MYRNERTNRETCIEISGQIQSNPGQIEINQRTNREKCTCLKKRGQIVRNV